MWTLNLSGFLGITRSIAKAVYPEIFLRHSRDAVDRLYVQSIYRGCEALREIDRKEKVRLEKEEEEGGVGIDVRVSKNLEATFSANPSDTPTNDTRRRRRGGSKADSDSLTHGAVVSSEVGSAKAEKAAAKAAGKAMRKAARAEARRARKVGRGDASSSGKLKLGSPPAAATGKRNSSDGGGISVRMNENGTAGAPQPKAFASPREGLVRQQSSRRNVSGLRGATKSALGSTAFRANRGRAGSSSPSRSRGMSRGERGGRSPVRAQSQRHMPWQTAAAAQTQKTNEEEATAEDFWGKFMPHLDIDKIFRAGEEPSKLTQVMVNFERDLGFVFGSYATPHDMYRIDSLVGGGAGGGDDGEGTGGSAADRGSSGAAEDKELTPKEQEKRRAQEAWERKKKESLRIDFPNFMRFFPDFKLWTGRRHEDGMVILDTFLCSCPGSEEKGRTRGRDSTLWKEYLGPNWGLPRCMYRSRNVREFTEAQRGLLRETFDHFDTDGTSRTWGVWDVLCSVVWSSAVWLSCRDIHSHSHTHTHSHTHSYIHRKWRAG